MKLKALHEDKYLSKVNTNTQNYGLEGNNWGPGGKEFKRKSGTKSYNPENWTQGKLDLKVPAPETPDTNAPESVDRYDLTKMQKNK